MLIKLLARILAETVSAKVFGCEAQILGKRPQVVTPLGFRRWEASADRSLRPTGSGEMRGGAWLVEGCSIFTERRTAGMDSMERARIRQEIGLFRVPNGSDPGICTRLESAGRGLGPTFRSLLISTMLRPKSNSGRLSVRIPGDRGYRCSLY